MNKEKDTEQTAKTTAEIEEECVAETAEDEKAADAAAKEEKTKDNSDNSTDEISSEKLKEMLADKEDLILRQRAEFDNYRKRTQREKEELYQTASADCILPFLAVLDNLERAVESDSEASEFKDGVAMILKQFRDLLEQMGVREIEALGEEFDPNRHNAVNRIEDENYGENIVCQVFQKGYEMKDKVLRHAMVVVANP